MDAAEGRIARCAQWSRHVLGGGGDLGLGGGVSRNGGGAETGNCEREDEKADNVVLHDVSP